MNAISTGMPLDPISTLRFTRRRESWVARSADHFYKIERASNDPLHDLRDPGCIATAQREYGDMRYLHRIDSAALCPERLDGACIVYPFLSGPDMHQLLKGNATRTQREDCLHEAIALLAHLHRGVPDGFPVKDYRDASFLAPGADLLKHMELRRRTLVMTGFEARNFRYDSNRGAWYFFDPHHLWQGFPEEDLARFVISLLMIRGKKGGPRPWTGFDRFDLLSSYERLAPGKLDRRLLNYFLLEQLAMRRFYAMRLARRMSVPIRIIGLAYTRLYYRQLRRALAYRRF